MNDLALVLDAIQETADDFGLNGDPLSETLVGLLEALHRNLARRRDLASDDDA